MKEQYIRIDEYGNAHYYSDRKMTIYHREDGPAYVGSLGGETWWANGKRHREDGPAVEYVNGHKEWYLNDEFVSKSEHSRRTAKETILTMCDIAAKFGVSVEQLKITK